MIPLRDVIPSRTTPGVTVTLIVLNVIIYLFGVMLSDRGRDAFIVAFGLVPAYFSLFNVFTAMFVHGGFAHVQASAMIKSSSKLRAFHGLMRPNRESPFSSGVMSAVNRIRCFTS